MPFLPSLPVDAGPPNVFMQYPQIYGPWSSKHAKKRVERGYVDLYPAFREQK
ncbi:hypothetical protein [Variovorax guangxiensis]|uniref:hypothetical protein n=1 Tax=Variovorax guangxiensis TaxID=1775474 RepID=UPI002857006E|nr:hypothetical protein [Variovorax guangxiensis]MDR6854890.1 hypothetical protein [Variovorax guangxiensis]